MRYLKLTVAYDGTDYVGWQIQENGTSVQQRLEETWFSVTQEQVRIMSSGRTDAGVHATAQVCSLATQTKLDNRTLIRALNATLPEDISVIEVQDAPAGFHATRDATAKTYRYQIQFGRIRDVHRRRYRWFVPRPLDLDAMREGAKYLIGEHDFQGFQAVGSERLSTVRHVMRLELHHWRESIFDYLDIEITSNGFLYNMVRNIVGTLVQVGQGNRPPSWVERVLQEKDRRLAGRTAPAHALFLIHVDYGSIRFRPD
jgi:tRNA pseudouridine38-40 synthase